MNGLVPQSDAEEAKSAAYDAEEEAIEATRAPLLEHLSELRDRLLWSVVSIAVGFAICFALWHYILEALLLPYQNAVEAVKGTAAAQKEMTLQTTGPLENFITRIKVALFGGLMLAFPMISFQLYRFVAPGLYSHEKKAFTPFLFMAPVLFTMGAAMAYFVVMPFVMKFSLSQDLTAGMGKVSVVYQGRLTEYVGMITTLILGFGGCFQLPVVQLLLGRAGIVEGDTWLSNGRYAIFGIFVVAAVVTPPDVISQLALAVPLIALYYMGAWMVKSGEPKGEKTD